MDAQELYEERDLLLQLRAGDERAFEILYRLHSKTIYRKLLGMVKVADIADELTQGLFIKVWEKRTLIDADRKFLIYILQMASNLVIDFYRRMAREQRLQEEVVSISTELYVHTEEELIYKESKATIDLAIASLPRQQRQVFTLCKIDGKSYQEVSRLLGISVSTISNHIVQANKSLKRALCNSEKTAIVILSAIFLDRL